MNTTALVIIAVQSAAIIAGAAVVLKLMAGVAAALENVQVAKRKLKEYDQVRLEQEVAEALEEEPGSQVQYQRPKGVDKRAWLIAVNDAAALGCTPYDTLPNAIATIKAGEMKEEPQEPLIDVQQ